MSPWDVIRTHAKAEFKALIAANRARYAVRLRDTPERHEPERSEPAVAPPEPFTESESPGH